jgi:hypothetical protein
MRRANNTELFFSTDFSTALSESQSIYVSDNLYNYIHSMFILQDMKYVMETLLTGTFKCSLGG